MAMAETGCEGASLGHNGQLGRQLGVTVVRVSAPSIVCYVGVGGCQQQLTWLSVWCIIVTSHEEGGDILKTLVCQQKSYVQGEIEGGRNHFGTVANTGNDSCGVYVYLYIKLPLYNIFFY